MSLTLAAQEAILLNRLLAEYNPKVASYSYHALAYLVLCISLYCFVAFLAAVSKAFGGSH